MKNSVPLLADLINSSNEHNGTHPQPSLRARLRYGARLKRAVRFEAEEIDPSFRLTSKRQNGVYSRYIE
jgi:hypothetical protein